MIFFLNSFSFSFSHTHVQTRWSLQQRLHRACVSFLRRRRHRAPLAAAYLNELVQEDLIVLINCQVLFICQEIFCLLSLLPVPLQLGGDDLRVLNRLVRPADARHFLLVRIHLSIIAVKDNVRESIGGIVNEK